MAGREGSAGVSRLGRRSTSNRGGEAELEQEEEELREVHRGSRRWPEGKLGRRWRKDARRGWRRGGPEAGAAAVQGRRRR